MGSYRNTLFLLAALITTACVYYALTVYVSHPKNISLYHNPDLVGEPYILHAFLYQNDHIANWRLTNAFFLFPDILIVYILTLFTQSIYPIFPIFAFLQMTAFTVLFSVLSKCVINKRGGWRLGFIMAMAFLLTLIFKASHGLGLYGNNDYLVTILTPAFHFGGFVNALLCTCLFLSVLKRPNIFLWSLLSLLDVIGGISDPLLHYYFTFPALTLVAAMALFKKEQRSLYVKMGVWFFGMIVTWYLIYTYVPLPFIKIDFKLSFPLTHLDLLYRTLHHLSKNNLVSIVCWLAFFIAAPISLIRTYLAKREISSLLDLFIAFVWLLIVVSCMGILTTNVHFGHDDTIPVRYLIPLINEPVFLGFPLLLYKHCQRFFCVVEKPIFYIGLLGLMSGLALHHPEHFYRENFFHYYPSDVACFDSNYKKFHLHNGLTTDWGMGAVITSYNRSNAQIVHYDFVAHQPNLWFTTTQLLNAKPLDFVLIQEDDTFSENQRLVFHYFGKPSQRFRCQYGALNETFYVYKSGPLKTFKLK